MNVTGQWAGPEQIAVVGGLDSTKPNAARVYDFLLGGKDNFAAEADAAVAAFSAKRYR